jgi:hypothetical protein
MRKALLTCAVLASGCSNSIQAPAPVTVPETAPEPIQLTSTVPVPTTTEAPTTTEPVTTTTEASVTTTTVLLREQATTTVVRRASPARNSSAELASIRACESGGDYTTNTGNGYQGAYQYDRGTWATASRMAGYGEWATTPVSLVPPAIQDAVTANYIAAGYRSAWPNC